MSEFKQIEPLPVEIGDELYFDYGNGTAEDGYVHLTSARRAHESTLDYAAAMRLHSTLSRALGLPDVAELQREVERLRSEREALLGVLEPAEGLTLADNVRDASSCVENGDWWDGRKQFVMELGAAATALEAALKGVGRG